ncbi:MAG: hypothetical protein QGF72_01595 [Candidatus Poseidoniaceae archaeon]|jgi:hypothetical protein|nr:hypothetical protein [Candidatus Poseidoniaceae archaeon]|tara:strand:- start:475 stop:663 length:189 start_codon:yes stop_codon:yes gene_type:complete
MGICNNHEKLHDGQEIVLSNSMFMPPPLGVAFMKKRVAGGDDEEARLAAVRSLADAHDSCAA